jgi:hypothetical protein
VGVISAAPCTVGHDDPVAHTISSWDFVFSEVAKCTVYYYIYLHWILGYLVQYFVQFVQHFLFSVL